MHPMSLRSNALLALLLGIGVAQAADGPLPLRPGAYVLASDKPCEEMALAGVIEYDARQGLFGPQESDCRTVVLAHKGNSYRVRRTCRANGDGTPAKSASFDMTVRIKSPTAFFTRLGERRDEDEFDLCPAFR